LTWKVFLPLALANIVAVMFVMQFGLNRIVLLPISILLFVLFGFFTVASKRMEINRRRRASLAMR
jgi:NADH-quinone oxidoreductase subunit H